jgi:hypothetical protein
MPVIFTREICMPEVNTEFLFTIALEIQVFSLGDTPYELPLAAWWSHR